MRQMGGEGFPAWNEASLSVLRSSRHICYIVKNEVMCMMAIWSV